MSAMQVLVLPVPVAMASSISRCAFGDRSLDGSDGLLLVGAQREAVVERLALRAAACAAVLIALEQCRQDPRACTSHRARARRLSGRRRSQNQMPLLVASWRR